MFWAAFQVLKTRKGSKMYGPSYKNIGQTLYKGKQDALFLDTVYYTQHGPNERRLILPRGKVVSKAVVGYAWRLEMHKSQIFLSK